MSLKRKLNRSAPGFVVPHHSISGRAHTPEQKRAILERLYGVWMRQPELRLGQLLDNSVHNMFYVEDEALMDALEMSFKEREK